MTTRGNQHATQQVWADPPDPRDRPFPPDTDAGDRYRTTEAEQDLERLEPLLDAVELPPTWTCDRYRELADRTWKQWGEECTGFALSSIAEYHLREAYRARSGDTTIRHEPMSWPPDDPAERERLTVSRRMMYEMGQRYDRQMVREGSTNRGALKGWNVVGVACDAAWRYEADDEEGEQLGKLTLRRVVDALGRPGGAYLRIEKTDVVRMKQALALNYPLLVSGTTHVGWIDQYLPDAPDVIRPDDRTVGGHAFVVVGWNEQGWLIHNSWGSDWGDDGYAVLPFADFAVNGNDVWFVFPPTRRDRVTVDEDSLIPDGRPADDSNDESDMMLHCVTLGDDGGLMPLGTPYGMDNERLKTMLFLFRQQTKEWTTRRLAIFADGGYWSTPNAIAQLRPLRDAMMAAEVYPIFLLWDTPWFADMQSWLYTGTGSEPGTPLPHHSDASDDPMVAELQELWQNLGKFAAVEVGTRQIWNQLNVRALAACRPGEGGARLLADAVAYNLTKAEFDVHLVGHGAGDLMLSRLATLLPAPISTCTLWAPATTMKQFKATYAPMLKAGYLEKLHLITLDETAEGADSMGPLPGSPLQLVSDVLALKRLDIHTALLKVDGEQSGGYESATAGDRCVWVPKPVRVLGMARDLDNDDKIDRLTRKNKVEVTALADQTHIGLLNDADVRQSTIDAIVDTPPPPPGGSSDPWPRPWGQPVTPDWPAHPHRVASDDPLDWFLDPSGR
ncbi:MAG: C1 family peptidase [Ilumatobacter sp.]|nr:C1 family peptidase [Ilumatobacter sp.]